MKHHDQCVSGDTSPLMNQKAANTADFLVDTSPFAANKPPLRLNGLSMAVYYFSWFPGLAEFGQLSGAAHSCSAFSRELGWAPIPGYPSPPTPHSARLLINTLARLRVWQPSPKREEARGFSPLKAWNPKFQNVLSLH